MFTNTLLLRLMKKMLQLIWNGRTLHASIFTDLLDVFGSGDGVCYLLLNYYKGTPAIICNKLEKGNVYYYGSVFDRDAATVFLKT